MANLRRARSLSRRSSRRSESRLNRGYKRETADYTRAATSDFPLMKIGRKCAFTRDRVYSWRNPRAAVNFATTCIARLILKGMSPAFAPRYYSVLPPHVSIVLFAREQICDILYICRLFPNLHVRASKLPRRQVLTRLL